MKTLASKGKRNHENWLAYFLLIAFLAFMFAVSYLSAISAGGNNQRSEIGAK
jgi:hypothetical protein